MNPMPMRMLVMAVHNDRLAQATRSNRTSRSMRLTRQEGAQDSSEREPRATCRCTVMALALVLRVVRRLAQP
jgi:hypothetical protein